MRVSVTDKSFRWPKSAVKLIVNRRKFITDTCYQNLSDGLLNELEWLWNLGISFIFGLRKFGHASDFRFILRYVPGRRDFRIYSFCTLFSLIPPLLPTEDCFLHQYTTLSRTLRSYFALSLNCSMQCFSFYTNSFKNKSINLWNSRRESIRRV